MPYKTPHYGLIAFLGGEIYSSSADQSRMSIIDSQMAGLAELVGDGLNTGWTLSLRTIGGNPYIVSSLGSGIADRYFFRTYGEVLLQVSDNSSFDVYMKRKTDVIQSISGYSNVVSVQSTDTTPPAKPTGLASIATFEKTVLTWTASVAVDIDGYIVKRSSDGGLTYQELAVVYTPTYEDTDVIQNRMYRYKVAAVDLSGNVSVDSNVLLVLTPRDTRPPLNPSYFIAIPSDSQISLLWGAPKFGATNYYEIEYTDAGEDGQEQPITKTINVMDTQVVLNNLKNNAIYSIRIKSVGTNGSKSEGILVKSSPLVGNFSYIIKVSDNPIFDGTYYMIPGGGGTVYNGELGIVTATLLNQGISGWYFRLENMDHGGANITYWTCPVVSSDPPLAGPWTPIFNNTFPINTFDISFRTIGHPVYGPTEVSVSAAASDWNPNAISMTVDWTPYSDSHVEPAVKYRVVVIENGLISSDPIEVFDEVSLTIDSFKVGKEVRKIKPQTEYIVQVRAVNASGDMSGGAFARFTTSTYYKPNPPTTLRGEVVDNTVVFSWTATASPFDHYLITVDEYDLTTLITTNLGTLKNIGRDTTYVMDPDDVDRNCTYTATLLAVDEEARQSDTVTASVTTPEDPDRGIPVPTGVFAIGGDNRVLLTWFPLPASVNAGELKIWRADYNIAGVSASDFVLIDAVDASLTEYEDLTVTNGNRYLYFLTTIDKYGNQSKNPVDNDYFNYPYAYAYVHSPSSFASPTDLLVENSGTEGDFDAVLTWSASTGACDGYEIFRSDGSQTAGSKTEWHKIAIVDSSTLTYTDVNALLDSKVPYYYAVRKFRNEAELVATNGEAPADSVFIGRASITGGVLTVDTSDVVYVSGLRTFVTERLDGVLGLHYHRLKGSVDNRIDLSRNVLIDDWETTDNQYFLTKQNITGASLYIPYLDGVKVTRSFVVNATQKSITFSSPLADGTLTVEAVGINETQGTLSEEKVLEIAASQVEGGAMSKERFGPIDHRGRVSEPLVPLQFAMESNDGYVFTLVANRLIEEQTGIPAVKLATATTFYDIIPVGSSLVAGTSKGLMRSDDRGESWSLLYSLPVPVRKLAYLPVANKYVALGGGVVYISDNGINWSRTNGLDGVSSVRDVTETPSGKIFVSTNIGVYAYAGDLSGEFGDWNQTTQPSGTTSECYTMGYDYGLYVTTDKYLYFSVDNGLSWSVSDVMPFGLPIRAALYINWYWYVLTSDGVFRRGPLDTRFYPIGYFEGAEASSFTIKAGVIYVASGSGLWVSDPDADIENDSEVKFFRSVPNLDLRTAPTPVFCVAQAGGYIYVGLDQRLFRVSSPRSSLRVYFDATGVSPTVYIDGVEKRSGYWYCVDTNTLYFEEPVPATSKVTVATQYQAFRAENGGWLDVDYDASVIIYKNGLSILTSSGYGLPLDQLNNISFDTFTKSNSEPEAALAYQTLFTASRRRLRDIQSGIETLKEGETLQSLVSKTIWYYQMTYSKWNGKIRFSPDIIYEGATHVVVGHEMAPYVIAPTAFVGYELIDPIPKAILEDDSICSIDASTGLFLFSENFDKYDNLSVTLKGAAIDNEGTLSHDDIEDGLEKINSGMPARLSHVYQSNFINGGLFLQREFGSDYTDETDPNCSQIMLHPSLQFRYIVPEDRSWYNQLRSTIDYQEEEVGGDVGFSVEYPNAVVYAFSKVFVASDAGLVSIRTDNYDISKVAGLTDEPFTDVRLVGSTLYTVSYSRLYSSTDGDEWVEEDISGLPNRLLFYNKLRDVEIVAAEDGVYSRYSGRRWTRALELSGIQLLISDMSAFVISGRELYVSSDGLAWSKAGNLAGAGTSSDTSLSDTIQPACVEKYKLAFFIGTSAGLRTDNGSFYGGSASLVATIKLESTVIASQAFGINAVAVKAGETEVVAGASNGNYYTFDGSSWTKHTDSKLSVIHKLVYVGSDIWLFGYDLVKIPAKTDPIKLCSGDTF